MNVVEKEALFLDGSDSELAPVKKPRAQAPVVGSRERRSLSGAEVRRLISERSEGLQKFVAPLEEHIRKATRLRTRAHRHGPRSVSKVAELVLYIVRKLAHRETGIYTLDPNIPSLLSCLYAGSVEASIVAGLVRRAQEALANVAALEQGEGARGPGGYSLGDASYRDYDVGRELDELTMLLKWYVRRKMSVARLDIGALSHGIAINGVHGTALALGGIEEEEDALFGFEVVHDQHVFGTKGCFVSCGLRLVGHAGQSLWLRVSVLASGRPVKARAEWSTWTDSGESDVIEVVPESAPFCSLVPIRPNSQRLIIDDIRAFVPYAALELETGRADVEINIAILDGEGREVLSAGRPDSICIPRREALVATVPAPHSVGMWPHDVVSGDRLSDLKVQAGYKSVGGWERHSVSVQFDLALFMHAGESVLLECRFLNAAGEVVELSSLGIPYVASDMNVAVESVSSYRYRRVLHPRGAWAHYRGLSIDIPVEFLLLSPGAHQLTCEVVIVSSDDRVLCGDMGSVLVTVPGERGEQAAEKNSIVALESVEIDAGWEFGGDESIRVQASFVPTNTSQQIAELAAGRVGELCSPYRVEIAIEREDGYLLLQAFSDSFGMGFKPVTRSICVEGYSGVSSHSVVANFSKEEILGWSYGAESQRGISKLRLFARVRALSLSGEVLVSQTKEFYTKPLSGGGRRVVEIGAPSPHIVDVVASTYAQTSRLSCRVLINMPHGRFLDEGITIVGTLVTAGGQRREVLNRRVASQRSALWIRQQVGLSQLSVECDGILETKLDLPGFVEFKLLSAYDETLQTVRHPVQVSGVLVDAAQDSSHHVEGDHRESARESSVMQAEVPGEGEIVGSHRKGGIFGWFGR